MRRWIVIASVFLAACGFQLRGAISLPFQTLYISLPESSPLHAAIKRGVEANGETRVVDNPKEAQATLTVLGDLQEKKVLSYSAAGRVREYQLVRTFTFRVHDIGGRDYLPQNAMKITRDVTFNDAQVLAKESEEALLWRDMQTDLIRQLLRRIAASKAPTVDKDE
jgi:LPS-assembly lipoprotein